MIMIDHPPDCVGPGAAAAAAAGAPSSWPLSAAGTRGREASTVLLAATKAAGDYRYR